MNSTKNSICICCGNRVTANERRPIADRRIRLFVATRLFPAYLPTDGYICNKCRSMYKKWKILPEFCDVLTMFDNCHQITSTAADDIIDEAEKNDERMDDENESDQPADDTSSEGDSMDNGSNGSQTMDVASSDDQSITDVAASDDEIEDEEMNSDDDRKAVSLILYRSYTFYITFQTFPMTSEVDANENSIQVPIGVAVFSKR